MESDVKKQCCSEEWNNLFSFYSFRSNRDVHVLQQRGSKLDIRHKKYPLFKSKDRGVLEQMTLRHGVPVDDHETKTNTVRTDVESAQL